MILPRFFPCCHPSTTYRYCLLLRCSLTVPIDTILRRNQVEYAIEAIKLGSTAVGIQTKEGVILAVEKRLTSPLLEPSSVEKVGKEYLDFSV